MSFRALFAFFFVSQLFEAGFRLRTRLGQILGQSIYMLFVWHLHIFTFEHLLTENNSSGKWTELAVHTEG